MGVLSLVEMLKTMIPIRRMQEAVFLLVGMQKVLAVLLRLYWEPMGKLKDKALPL